MVPHLISPRVPLVFVLKHCCPLPSQSFQPRPSLTSLPICTPQEDPATGSAHAVLGPYWAQRLGKQRLAARQCSKRGAELLVEVKAEEGRVVVSGSAVTVLLGELLLPAGA